MFYAYLQILGAIQINEEIHSSFAIQLEYVYT